MEVWVIQNVNGSVWGLEAFTSEAVAREELRTFFDGKYAKDKFKFLRLTVMDTITGDYAGMGNKK